MLNNQSAGGKAAVDTPTPSRKQVKMQVGKGAFLPEFSTDTTIFDRFSHGRYGVVVRIKQRYLAAGSYKRGSLLPKVYDALAMTVREKPKRPGFAVLMKGFLGTDPYHCILCKGRLRFAGAVAGENATKLLSDRLHRMTKKRWLQTLTLDKCA